MAKITNFMRVTKQPKVHGKKEKSVSATKSQVFKKEETLPLEDADVSDEDPAAHLPLFIYEFVKYKPKHKKHEMTKGMKLIVEYIKKYYNVPADFETNGKFGCHSGLTYEQRLTRAYSMGHLYLKHGRKGGTTPKPICLTCATVGHTYKKCPDGF